MTVSVFDLFKIGVGPSSSHTVGPMRAGWAFATELRKRWIAAAGSEGEATQSESSAEDAPDHALEPVTQEKIAGVVSPVTSQQSPVGRSISVVLYGSLAATGAGHGTLDACLLGLDGSDPSTVDPDYMTMRIKQIRETRTIYLAGDKNLPVTCGFEDIILRPAVRRTIHTNAVTFVGIPDSEHDGFKQTYYSIGGGFILSLIHI